MKEIYGDFWQAAPDYGTIVVTTNSIVKNNGELVMGGGIAKEFADRYPELPAKLGKYTTMKLWKNMAHFALSDNHLIVGLRTKYDWRDNSDIDLIIESVKYLKKIVDNTGLPWYNKALMTRPGCGLGGLLWEDVKPKIEPLLDDRFTVIERHEA